MISGDNKCYILIVSECLDIYWAKSSLLLRKHIGYSEMGLHSNKWVNGSEADRAQWFECRCQPCHQLSDAMLSVKTSLTFHFEEHMWCDQNLWMAWKVSFRHSSYFIVFHCTFAGCSSAQTQNLFQIFLWATIVFDQTEMMSRDSLIYDFSEIKWMIEHQSKLLISFFH